MKEEDHIFTIFFTERKWLKKKHEYFLKKHLLSIQYWIKDVFTKELA
ncbi:hypothetical protein [Parachlamydia acanthamoebae]|nr:hypothetical protein [Parachlamydia acanthamoebae]